MEQRHRALVERDRQVGLEAEASSARAHAELLQRKLDVVQARLVRKNARIKQLVAQVRELEADVAPAAGWRNPLTRLTRRR